jgi:PIN domain nuclease of toxin-antitoxin system
MNMKYLLDTHVWLWWNARPEALSHKARGLLTSIDEEQELLLSAASVWELCCQIEDGRLGLSTPVEDWIEQALAMPGLRFVPIVPRVAARSTALPGEFEGDSFDRLIATTAREENAALITSDLILRNYPYVKTIW